MIVWHWAQAGRRAVRALIVGIYALANLATAAAEGEPVITVQPMSNLAGRGEDVSFSVTATGEGPLRYQWLFNGRRMSRRTNSFLLITNLTSSRSGNYAVRVENAVGSVRSEKAYLVVQRHPARRLGTGRILQEGSSVGVPIVLRSNGRESSVSFSMLFDRTAYGNPTFTPSDITAMTTVNAMEPGAVGVEMTLPEGRMFPQGYPTLGLLRFALAPGKGPYEGLLNFADTPQKIEAGNTNGKTLEISASVTPQFTLVTTNPVLHLQSGLFEHQLVLSNPGVSPMTNINILALDLGVDANSNSIRFFNSQSTLSSPPYGDPLIGIDCGCECGLHVNGTQNCTLDEYLDCLNFGCALNFFGRRVTYPVAFVGPLAPGESRTVTLEYYVGDHATIPTPAYALHLTGPVRARLPSSADARLPVARTVRSGDSMLVEFPTVPGKRYYIQYAETMSGLSTGRVVLPPIIGTGGPVQWIDNGPPKTTSAPTNGPRYYRLRSNQ